MYTKTMKKRVAGRPKKEAGEVLVDLPFKVDPEALDIVQRIADGLERPRGWTARKLLMRGIEVYSHDLKDMRPEDAIQMREAAAAIIKRLEAADDRRFNRPGGFELMTGRQWEDEDRDEEDLIEQK
jgi:hypothetical protein